MAHEQLLGDMANIVEGASSSRQDQIVAQFVINALTDFGDRGLISVQDQSEPTQTVRQRRMASRPASTEIEGTVDLNAEWQRQSLLYIEHRFHVEAGLPDTNKGKQAFMDSLPKFGAQPEKCKGRFDIPLLVIGKQIPWEKQAELAGIDVSEYLKSRSKEIKPYIGNRTKTPDKPFTGWFNKWGQRFTAAIKPSDARGQLQSDEIGGILCEAVAMQLAHPEFNLNRQYFDLIGEIVESDDVPCLDRWDDRPGFDAFWRGGASGCFRPLVRGSEIVTG